MNIVICGIRGKMGNALLDAAAGFQDIKISAGIDTAGGDVRGIPVFTSAEELNEKPHALIDFSRPEALTGLLQYATAHGVPLVLCTTGYTSEQDALIEKAARKTAILRSGNMSLGINAMQKLIKTAFSGLCGFDVEIIERHHNQKVDAPSGTAKMLAREIPHDVAIHSVRGGTIVGEHEVVFMGNDEIITVSHTALSKRIFADGAFRAALFLRGKPSGLYSMSDVIEG